MLTIHEQIEKVVRLRDDEELTFTQIGEKVGVSERTARRRYEAGVLQRTAGILTDESLERFPEVEPLIIKAKDYLIDDVQEIERFKPLVIRGDALLVCDLHIPLVDKSFINVMLKAARKHKIKKLVIAGDYWNFDEFSSYPPIQPEAKFKLEREEGNLIMKTLLRWFEEVALIWGNHDYRLTKALGYKYSFIECMKWALSSLTEKEMSKIKFSDLDYMYYYPGGPMDWKIRVCHPNNFSDVPLAVGEKLAKKYGCSIYTAHSHHCALGAARNGHDLLIEGGGFFDKNRTEYIQRTNANHEWVQGFFYFKDGFPHMISPLIGTDLEYRGEVNK